MKKENCVVLNVAQAMLKNLFLALFLLALLVACDDSSSSKQSRNLVLKNSIKEILQSIDSNGLSSSVMSSSSSVYSCLTENEDNCEYGTLIDSRDNLIYKTLKIGDMEWMAQSLNFEMENSGCYKDSVSNCAKFGRLYTWAAANSACPVGWHIPTAHEWNILLSALGFSWNAMKWLCSNRGLFSTSIGDCSFWSSTVNGNSVYVVWIGGFIIFKDSARSHVRCLKDQKTDVLQRSYGNKDIPLVN